MGSRGNVETLLRFLWMGPSGECPLGAGSEGRGGEQERCSCAGGRGTQRSREPASARDSRPGGGRCGGWWVTSGCARALHCLALEERGAGAKAGWGSAGSAELKALHGHRLSLTQGTARLPPRSTSFAHRGTLLSFTAPCCKGGTSPSSLTPFPPSSCPLPAPSSSRSRCPHGQPCSQTQRLPAQHAPGCRLPPAAALGCFAGLCLCWGPSAAP